MKTLAYQIDSKRYQEEKKKIERLIKARNKAMALIADAQARYVKEKTRARSKKAAMEKDALLNSPKYKVLNDYESERDIQDAYGMAVLTQGEYEKLLDLWEEREEVRYKKDKDGFYKDEVTKALHEAYVHIADLWEDDIDKSREVVRTVDEQIAKDKQRAEEYEKVIEKQYNDFVKAKPAEIQENPNG